MGRYTAAAAQIRGEKGYKGMNGKAESDVKVVENKTKKGSKVSSNA